VRLYSSVRATLAALDHVEGEHASARVTFVHDRISGNKLFADKVWYVSSPDGALAAFLLKSNAQEWASKNQGAVVDFSAARKLARQAQAQR